MDLQISKLSNIIINKDYNREFDANDVFNIQGIRATGESTTNLPSEVPATSRYGILHTYLDEDGDGYQQYVPMNGNWKNTFFKRRIKTSESTIGEWEYLLDSSEWTNQLTTEDNTILGAINEVNTKKMHYDNTDWIDDANDFENIQGLRLTDESTINLYSNLSSLEKWGFLYTMYESADEEYSSVVQIYYPTWGNWMGGLLIRCINYRLTDGEIVENDRMDWTEIYTDGNWYSELKTDSDRIIGAINEIYDKTVELENVTSDLSSLSVGNFALIDNTTEGCASEGTLTTDLMASNGKAYIATTTSTAFCLFKAIFSEVKFGKYALCMRLKISANTSTSTVLTVNVLNGSTIILSKPIIGTNFDKINNYCYICTTFDYDGSSETAKQPLQLNINTGTVEGLEVKFDYAYITLITPAVYI